MQKDGQPQSLITRISRISSTIVQIIAVITGLATCISIIAASFQYMNTDEKKPQTYARKALTTYETFGDVIKASRTTDVDTYEFLRTTPIPNSQECSSLLEKYHSGSIIYYLPQYKELRETIEFYEDIDTMLRAHTLEFPVVFDMITYPTDFYKATKDFLNFLKANWFGKGQALDDAFLGFDQLGTYYDMARAANSAHTQYNPQIPPLVASKSIFSN